MTAQSGDFEPTTGRDGEALCPVRRTVYGRPCDGPGTYYCDSEVWGSECRRHFEQIRDALTEVALAPAAVADNAGEVTDCPIDAGAGSCSRAAGECCSRPAASPGGQADERCSGPGCWYTLPVVDGLIVAHSAPMTLDHCEGSGRPPLAPQADDGRTEELRAVLLRHHPIARTETGPLAGCRCGQVKFGQDVIVHVLDQLAPLLAAATGRGDDGAVRLRREAMQEARRQAWAAGYEACRHGEQKHNPYPAAVAGGQDAET